MTSIDHVVIVGAGLAGARAAEGLRKEGFEGAVTLVGEELDRPYLRPPLSKEFLRGEGTRDQVYVHPASFEAENRIETLTGVRVVSIDPADRRAVLSNGSRLAYDRLLLATGARPRQLQVPGAGLPGIISLRTLTDAEALRAAAIEAKAAVVIGAGWIGTEVAASLRQMGLQVVVVAPDAMPLERVLGPEIGGVYHELHRQHGVEFRLGTTVTEIIGRDRVQAVRTADGESIAADLVVVGIGALPRIELAAAAGLAVGDGIEVDPTLATSAGDIFAAGDVASAWNPFFERRIRSEHWANAKFQGLASARSMLGGTEPFDRLPYFYSDQYELGMEYTGLSSPHDRLVVRGSLDDREFIAFWTRDGRVVAAMNANIWDVTKSIGRLIRSKAVVDPGALADPAIPLDELDRLRRAA